MSRIASTFSALRVQRRRALMPFLMGGDPSLDATEAFLLRFAESGADLLEIGVPFSDPIADGPVNQRAAQRALGTGATMSAVLEMVARVRPRLSQPIVLLSYYNPIYRLGLETFCSRATAVGVDGVVIVTRPEITERIVRECGDVGVRRVWMHQGMGKGSSVSQQAVEYCRQHEISVIAGACPMMYGPGVDFGHTCMRWVLKLTGGLPG